MDNSQKKKSYYVFRNMHNRNHAMESQKQEKCNFSTSGKALFSICGEVIEVTKVNDAKRDTR